MIYILLLIYINSWEKSFEMNRIILEIKIYLVPILMVIQAHYFLEAECALHMMYNLYHVPAIKFLSQPMVASYTSLQCTIWYQYVCNNSTMACAATHIKILITLHKNIWLHLTIWWWGWDILWELGQCHGCGCPGSLHQLVISSHGIDTPGIKNIVLHNKGFYLQAPFQCWEIIVDGNVC